MQYIWPTAEKLKEKNPEKLIFSSFCVQDCYARSDFPMVVQITIIIPLLQVNIYEYKND